jgi:thiol-disulfide isomerase/thioredoxin
VVRALAALALAQAACVVAAPPPAVRAPTEPPPRVAHLNASPGAMVDIERHLVPGYVTVVDFWAEWCAACKTIEAQLMVEVANEPAVVLRKVDVGAGDSEVARAYRLGGLPHLRVFDRHRRLRYVLVGQDALSAGRAALALAREP